MTLTEDELDRCLRDVPEVKKKLIPKKRVKGIGNRMKLLSHPTRLQILKLLSERDLCVCVLSDVIGKKQPNISQHLAKLKDSGIVDCYQAGKLVYYQIKDKEIRNIVRMICARWTR